jgi:capsular polysaccharide transport system permease protein
MAGSIKTEASAGRQSRANPLFLVAVVLPVLLSVIYFGLIASDVYISESRFIVRMPDRQSASALGSLLQGAGFSRSQDDSYTVQDFILSRDALRLLEEKLGFKERYSSADIDVFGRFNPLGWQDSFEDLFEYYLGRIEVLLDSASSITTLTVRAYSADDAYSINRHLIDISEQLVNNLNERGRYDMIRFAEKEVVDAEKRDKEAALALSAYQNLVGVIDPTQQSTMQLQQVAKLQDELISAKTQLEHLQTFTKSNPQIPAVKKRVQTLEEEIRKETEKIVGGSKSLVNKAAEYQRLIMEKEFADKQVGSAMASLEQARNEAVRKQLYLELIVQPNMPDVALEPRRIRGVIATLILGLISWGVLSLFIAGAKEHSD